MSVQMKKLPRADRCASCSREMKRGDLAYIDGYKRATCARCIKIREGEAEAMRGDDRGYNAARGGGKRRSASTTPKLVWTRPADVNELWEAVAPDGRYTIRVIGAYRTGAKRYDVRLVGSSSYHNTYLGDFATADAAKRAAAEHANRAVAGGGKKRSAKPSARKARPAALPKGYVIAKSRDPYSGRARYGVTAPNGEDLGTFDTRREAVAAARQDAAKHRPSARRSSEKQRATPGAAGRRARVDRIRRLGRGL